MSKRKRFIITSIILSLGFAGIQFFDERYRFVVIAALSLLTLAFFTWSLIEGLGKNTTLLALILPTFFTLGVGLFWFLLPTTVFARIPVILFYGFGIYVLNNVTKVSRNCTHFGYIIPAIRYYIVHKGANIFECCIGCPI